MTYSLETPRPPSLLYIAQGLDEVDEFRPVFTGDVFQKTLDDQQPNAMIVLQHPCSLRVDGNRLEERLLMAQIVQGSKPRTDWNKHTYKEMPLPDLTDNPDINHLVSFRHLELFNTEDLWRNYQRTATLSPFGINLLLQRWIFHNSRVVIPTITFDEQIAGPYNEADLEAEWLSELNETPHGNSQAFHDWIRAKPDASEERRQKMLEDPQKRSFIRREMTQEIDWLLSQASST